MAEYRELLELQLMLRRNMLVSFVRQYVIEPKEQQKRGIIREICPGELMLTCEETERKRRFIYFKHLDAWVETDEDSSVRGRSAVSEDAPLFLFEPVLS